MNEKLYELLLKLPRRNLLNLMLVALDEMQSYNGRSAAVCILLAVGATEDEEESGRWRLPSLAQIREITNDCPLL